MKKDEKTVCGICKEELYKKKDEETLEPLLKVKLPCGYIFHTKCIEKEYNKNEIHNCPQSQCGKPYTEKDFKGIEIQEYLGGGFCN